MRRVIIDQDIPLTEDRRLIKKLWKVDKSSNFPNGLEMAYQFLYFKDKEWIRVARIDNQLHEGKPGTHIHILKRQPEFIEIDFGSVEEKIIEMAENVIKNIINRWFK
jgi:type III secretion system FlhB-like substrate exporter